jgi:hypothetical protein
VAHAAAKIALLTAMIVVIHVGWLGVGVSLAPLLGLANTVGPASRCQRPCSSASGPRQSRDHAPRAAGPAARNVALSWFDLDGGDPTRVRLN